MCQDGFVYALRTLGTEASGAPTSHLQLKDRPGPTINFCPADPGMARRVQHAPWKSTSRKPDRAVRVGGGVSKRPKDSLETPSDNSTAVFVPHSEFGAGGGRMGACSSCCGKCLQYQGRD